MAQKLVSLALILAILVAGALLWQQLKHADASAVPVNVAPVSQRQLAQQSASLSNVNDKRSRDNQSVPQVSTPQPSKQPTTESHDSSTPSTTPQPQPQAMNVDGVAPIPTATAVLDAEQFDFAQLLQGQTYIDAQIVVQVLGHHDFSTFMARLAAINKSGMTTAYEQQLQDVALAHSAELSDYRIACSDALCMAEFQSFDAAALNQFIDEFTASDNSLLKADGVVFKYPRPNGDNGSSGYRLAFSTSTDINSVAFANE